MRLIALGIAVVGSMLAAGSLSPAFATPTPRPSPTYKVCHICDEELVLPAPTVTPTSRPVQATPTELLSDPRLPPDEGTRAIRAVMYWSDGCPDCHEVLDHVLPSLRQQYGDQLEIQLIEVSTTQDVERLYETAATFGIDKDRVGVPFLIVDDRVFIGSQQIASELPSLIEQRLAAGEMGDLQLPDPKGAEVAVGTDADLCAPAEPCPDETLPDQGKATAVLVTVAGLAVVLVVVVRKSLLSIGSD